MVENAMLEKEQVRRYIITSTFSLRDFSKEEQRGTLLSFEMVLPP